MSHRVVTYNVLSSALCAPSYFIGCDPDHLNPNKRLERILKMLHTDVEKKSIIHLQEVSRDWYQSFVNLFSQNGYQHVYAPYGNEKTGYMGLITAYPGDKYYTEFVETRQLSTLIPYKDVEEDDPYAIACNRANMYIFVRLVFNDNTFCMMNYHMPCVFTKLMVMLLHCGYIRHRTFELAGNDPFILAGDFNSIAHKTEYRLLTDGIVDADMMIPSTYSDRLLVSAYRVIDEHEPEYTCYSKVLSATDMFKDTIDYIFSHNMTITSVDKLPILTNEIPDAHNPSDHLKLGCTFTF